MCINKARDEELARGEYSMMYVLDVFLGKKSRHLRRRDIMLQMCDDAGRRENDESIWKDLKLRGRSRVDKSSVDGLGGFIHNAVFFFFL